jgi:hypothetical protein
MRCIGTTKKHFTMKEIRSDHGKCILALMIGFGLSTLFHKTCIDYKDIGLILSLEEVEELYRYD